MSRTLQQLKQQAIDHVMSVLEQNLDELMKVVQGAQPEVVRRLEEELNKEREKVRSLQHNASNDVDVAHFKQMEAKKRLEEYKINHDNAIKSAIHEERERNIIGTKTMCEEFTMKIALSERKIMEATAANALLQKQLEDAKASATRNPIMIGAAGEMEIEQYLSLVLQGFMTVKNVSKIGQGHEMDFQLVSRDGTVQIRIDVKNGLRLPDDEINRFYREIDTLKPTGAILFSKCALKCENGENPKVNARMSRRGKIMVYQIGCWSKEMLLEAIHDIITCRKVELECQQAAMKPFPGAHEVSKAFQSCSKLLAYQNEKAAKAYEVIAEWKHVGTEKNRVVADDLRAAHAANGNAVTIETLTEFEANVPKRSRGRPPQAEKTPRKRKSPEEKEETPIKPPSSTNAALERMRQSASNLTKLENSDVALKKQKLSEDAETRNPAK